MSNSVKLFFQLVVLITAAVSTIGNTATSQAQGPLVITSPVGGSDFTLGEDVTLEWVGGDPSWLVDFYLIEITPGLPFAIAELVAWSIPNMGSFDWTFPEEHAFGDPCEHTYVFYVQKTPPPGMAATYFAYGPDITVTCADTTAPQVECAVDFGSLWPPKHDLVDVGLTAFATDDVDDAPQIDVVVYSDECDGEQTGAGHHAPDAKIDDDSLRLRAERKGNGDGRVYLIVVTATDAAGNVGYDCCTVVVPKSKSKKAIAALDAQTLLAEAYCEEFAEPPPGFFEVGNGLTLGPKQ